jgi:hypothetical protein
MYFRIFICFLLSLVHGWVWAASAGQVVFTAGQALVDGSSAQLGQAVAEGQALQTGPDGYLYIQTSDKGFFILRPNSNGTIVTYQIDPANPANSRFKLELSSGVARHISGTAVKAARSNFRFNTPVAAIGVRGTDFTVFANSSVTRITVLSGGVVVSPLAGSCMASGFGPCEGGTSRELFAEKSRKILQISPGKTPILLPGGEQSPDATAPPRADEPTATRTSGRSASGSVSVATSGSDLDALRSSQFNQLASQLGQISPAPGFKSAQTLQIVDQHSAAPTALALQTLPTVPAPPQLIWGRWQPLLDRTVEIDVSALQTANQLVATNAYYAIMRNSESTWKPPPQSSMAFSLRSSEAVIQDSAGRITPAGVENGHLMVDFVRSSFFTRFDLVDQNQRFLLQNRGEVTSEGRLRGGAQFLRPNNVNVNGALANDNSGAALLFQSRLDDGRLASGTTFWGK